MKFKFKHVLPLLLPYFVLYIIGGLLSIPVNFLPYPSHTIHDFLKNLPFLILPIIILIIIRKHFFPIYLKLKWQSKQQGMSCFMKGAFIMMVMLAITLGLCYYANGFQIIALEQRFIGLNPIILHLILIGIISNLFVCITEELLFRGFIITYLNQFSISYWKVIFIAAFIFSAGHIYSDPIHYIIAFLGGVTLGFAYYKTQSLYYCMGIHFMYNLYNYLFTSAINEKPNTLIRPFIIKYEASILSVDKIDLFICMTFIGLFLYLWYKLGHREGLDRFAD